MNPTSTNRARMAGEADLPKIEHWLKEEAARTGERGFLHNWNLIEKGIEEGHLHVLDVQGEPVAFLLGTDIMEVRPKYRGAGYGTALARYMFETYCRDRAVLTIQCAPSTSLSFWQKLGFRQLDTTETYPSQVYAFKTFEQDHALGQGRKVPYSISFYNESLQWAPGSPPFKEYTGLAEDRGDGTFVLDKWAICFDPSKGPYAPQGDSIIRVEVAGEVWFEDKIKRDEATRFGVHRDEWGGYLIRHLVEL